MNNIRFMHFKVMLIVQFWLFVIQWFCYMEVYLHKYNVLVLVFELFLCFRCCTLICVLLRYPAYFTSSFL